MGSLGTARGRIRGFTLIELLVVIAVVAVLLSLMLPALWGGRESARGVKCLAGLRSFGQAVVLYVNDHREHFPLSSHSAKSILAPDAWLQSLEPYGFEKISRRCIADPKREQKLTSYASNEHFEPLTPGIDYSPLTCKPLPGGRLIAHVRIGLVPRPWAAIYAFEPEGEGTIDHLNTHQFQTPKDVKAALAVTRHVGGTNMVFADGHARAWPWSDLGAGFSPVTSPFDPETAK